MSLKAVKTNKTNKTNKTKKNKKNKKNKLKMVEKVAELTPEQRAIVCKKSANTYDTFEDKVEEAFKQNKINILATSYNLERQIIQNLQKAVNPKNVKPNEDYYSYINDRWISELEISEEEKYIVQLDDFRLTQHRSIKS